MRTTEKFEPVNTALAKSQIISRWAVTLFALVLIRLLFHIPIPGTLDLVSQMLSEGVKVGPTGSGLPPSLSIAAIAFFPWLTATILGQVFVMVVPLAWSGYVAQDGFINPFSWLVLLAALAISYLQASGVAFSLETTILPANGDQFQQMAIASLLAGTAVTIACAYAIDRFGIGNGFWMAFAALSLVNLTAEASLAIEMVSTGIVAPTAIALAGLAFTGLAALIIFVARHVQSQGGSFQIVIWPLLIASLLAPHMGGAKEMPEILLPILIVTLIIAASTTVVLAWRGGKPQLLLPVFAALAVVEIAAYFPLALFPFMLPLPPPTAEFVAVIVLLTVLVQPIRSKLEQRSAEQKIVLS